MTTLEKRQGLSRDIGYRIHVKIFYYIGWAITVLAIPPIVRLLANSGFIYQEWLIVICYLIMVAIVLSFMFLALTMIRSLAFTKFKVNPDRLEIVRHKKNQTILYADVAAIQFSNIPFITAMFTLKMKDNSSHIFTMAIERSEYIIDSLYSFNPSIFNVEKMASYRRSAVVIDHAVHRLERSIKKYPRMVFKYLLYPLALCWICYLLDSRFADTFKANWPIILFVNIFIGVICYYLFDLSLVSSEKRELAQNPNNLRVDLARERRYDLMNQCLYVLLSAACVPLWYFASR